MWRGFFVSWRYSVNCWSESLRPNQVFHQNRNGMRQISHAVMKKRSFWVRDMPGLGFLSSSMVAGLDILADSRSQKLEQFVTVPRPRMTQINVQGPANDGVLVNLAEIMHSAVAA